MEEGLCGNSYGICSWSGTWEEDAAAGTVQAGTEVMCNIAQGEICMRVSITKLVY